MYHLELLNKVKDAAMTVRKIEALDNYDVERLEEMVNGLFSFSKFKAEQIVTLKKSVPVSQDENWGWFSARHLLVEGSKAKVVGVEWYKNAFRYQIRFLENTWIDSQGLIQQSVREVGLFTFSEEWLALGEVS